MSTGTTSSVIRSVMKLVSRVGYRQIVLLTCGRTTNACESFHSEFNSSFYEAHPDLYTFTDTLLLFQNKTYIKINSTGTSNKLPCTEFIDRQKFGLQKMQDYEEKKYRFMFVNWLNHYRYHFLLGAQFVCAQNFLFSVKYRVSDIVTFFIFSRRRRTQKTIQIAAKFE